MKKKKQRLQNLLPLGTVKELRERYEYAELQMELKRLCKVEMLPLMLEAYNRLRTVIPKETDKVIQVAERWENASPMIDINCHVRTRSGVILVPVAACESWPELMDMPVYCDRTLELTEKEVLAGILWEVAYYKDCYLKNIEKTDKIG